MADVHSKQTRSKNMSAIHSKNTKPEQYLQGVLESLGYEFLKNQKHLPGTPDFVLPELRCCVFVNGCYWHKHENCHLFRPPLTRSEFWVKKLQQNVERDQKAHTSLISRGWKVIVVWECGIRGKMRLEKREFAQRLNLLIHTKPKGERVLELR